MSFHSILIDREAIFWIVLATAKSQYIIKNDLAMSLISMRRMSDWTEYTKINISIRIEQNGRHGKRDEAEKETEKLAVVGRVK